MHSYFSIPYFLIYDKLRNVETLKLDDFEEKYHTIIRIYAKSFGRNIVESKKQEKLAFKKIIVLINSKIYDLFLGIYSLISVIYFVVFKNHTVANWTGDFYNKTTRGDFRLGHLYDELYKHKIDFIEFIRNDGSANGINK